MGFLKRFFRGRASVQQLPTGTITVDRQGHIVTSTVASAYPKRLLLDIGADVLSLFKDARAAEMPLTEISLHFGSLHVTARELRGGAIIFLFPQTASAATPNPSRP
jgi:molybdopterin-binding protein